MRIQLKTDYALRVVCYLMGKTEMVRVVDLAKTLGIPFNSLRYVITRLSEQGIVMTICGPTGGVRLLRVPEKISVLEVLECMEGKIKLNRMQGQTVGGTANDLVDQYLTELQERLRLFLNLTTFDTLTVPYQVPSVKKKRSPQKQVGASPQEDVQI